MNRNDKHAEHRRIARREHTSARKLHVAAAKIRPRHLNIDKVRVHSVKLGRRHWGGGADVMGQFVAPFMLRRFGLAKGSGKRTPQHNAEIGGSTTSDHLTTRTDCFARDFPTFAGEPAALALAAAFGWHGWEANSYDTFYVIIDGHRFRVQILWGAAIDHDDHVHVGIELADL